MRPDRSGFRWRASYYAYEVLWRLLFVIALPFVGIGRAILWIKRKD